MKPYGLTAAFQIVKPTEVENAIYDAVERAFDAGMTVQQFRRECAECWEIHLRQRSKDDMEAWARP